MSDQKRSGSVREEAGDQNNPINGTLQKQQDQQIKQQGNGKEQPKPVNDISKWWPIFGRKTAGSSSTFWLKNTKQLTLEELEAESPNININSTMNEETMAFKSKQDGVAYSLNITEDGSNELQKEKQNHQHHQLNKQNSYHVFTGLLNRIDKKKKVTKEYLYKQKGNYLAYYIPPPKGQSAGTIASQNEGILKGYLKLGQDIILEKKSLSSKNNNDIHYIELLKDGNVRKLYTKNGEIINALFQQIRGKCILQNFRNNYKKLDLLGSGSFASVFKVERISDGKIFAAKIIKRSKLEENKFKEKFVAMLFNEYLVLSQSHHKNIIRMEEIYQDSDQLCYIMEYLVGGEIYQRLRTVKKFSEELAAEILKNIAEGLQHIHNNKIVHRDLKLENIMFVNKNDNDCKLIDFGFAEKINYEKLESRAGTPGFLPPELFKLGPYTEKGDIFSLGVILYCLISGYSPFKGKTYKEVLDNNRKCSISFEQPVWNKVSEECKYLIKRMVELDPKKRYNCENVFRSKWMQKFYPSLMDSQKSLNTIQTKNKMKFNSSFSKNSILDDELRKSLGSKASGDSGELNNSTIINLHSDNPKSFYRKSMKSIKSLKSLKSHFSHKTMRSHPSESSEENESGTDSNGDVHYEIINDYNNKTKNEIKENNNDNSGYNNGQSSQKENKLTNENLKEKGREKKVSKTKEDFNHYYDVEDEDGEQDEQNNLAFKLLTLLTPNKKFIHPLTQAASKQKVNQTRV